MSTPVTPFAKVKTAKQKKAHLPWNNHCEKNNGTYQQMQIVLKRIVYTRSNMLSKNFSSRQIAI